jgi:hypothetical protein
MSIKFDIKEIREFIADKTLELPVTIKLKSPVQLTASELIDSITVHREPTAGDLEELPTTGQKMKDWQKPLSSMTGQTIVVIRKLSASDFMGLAEVLGYFLAGSQKTGEEV